jgi:hypothetical protein
MNLISDFEIHLCDLCVNAVQTVILDSVNIMTPYCPSPLKE